MIYIRSMSTSQFGQDIFNHIKLIASGNTTVHMSVIILNALHPALIHAAARLVRPECSH